MIQQLARITVLTAVSVIFCALTAVLGAAPLVVLRNTEGRWAYLLGVTVATAAMFYAHAYVLAIPFVGIAILVFALIEGIELGGGLLKSGALALTLCAGIGLISLGIWSKNQGVEIVTWIRDQIGTWISQVPQLQSAMAVVDVDSLVAQTPSVSLMLMTLSMWMGVMFGRKFANDRTSTEFLALRLRDFTLPDQMVWVLIFAMPGAFMPQEINLWHVISINVFNFMVFLYFLKGLAIVATYFAVYRIGLFWQGLMYVLFISQLFLLVSVIGLADIWMNLKLKLIKKSAEPIER